ncbi:hypothetical protein ANN_13310, partial [Periplaneta americana]
YTSEDLEAAINDIKSGLPKHAAAKKHNVPRAAIQFTFKARFSSGLVVPSMVVFPYKRIPAQIGSSVPDSWGIGRSDRGWMKTEVFYEYVGNVFVSFLKEKNI